MGIRDGVQRGRECKAASGVSGVVNEVRSQDKPGCGWGSVAGLNK